MLKSGVPNAIKAFKDILLPQGITNCAIRLDSGDLTYLSRKARKMLDAAGLTECKIVASNSLDEYIIRDLLLQGAKIDSFGVGERLITSKSEPVFGGVYKLAAVEDKQGNIIPKIKISANPDKITNPHFKKVYRLFDKESGKAFADLITLHDEAVDESQPLELFDPDATWKRSWMTIRIRLANFSTEFRLRETDMRFRSWLKSTRLIKYMWRHRPLRQRKSKRFWKSAVKQIAS